MKPINVIFTGLVRTPERFVKSIEDFASLRSEGLINDIVFATWIGEIEKYKGLRKALKDHGLHLIEAEQPPRAIGYVWHQMKSWNLRHCWGDCWSESTGHQRM